MRMALLGLVQAQPSQEMANGHNNGLSARGLRPHKQLPRISPLSAFLPNQSLRPPPSCLTFRSQGLRNARWLSWMLQSSLDSWYVSQKYTLLCSLCFIVTFEARLGSAKEAGKGRCERGKDILMAQGHDTEGRRTLIFRDSYFRPRPLQ